MNRICRELTQIPESRRALPLLLIFSASLMGALFIVRWNADLNFDGEIYIAAARKYAAGMYREGLAEYPMPLYPYLISLIHKFIPNWVLAGRLISYFSMTLTVIPVYLLSQDLFDRRAAFWGCIAFTLLPETLLHSSSVLRDPPFFLFCMSAIYLAQKAITSKRLLYILSSALFAWVSTLLRVEGLIIFPVYFCILFVLAISERDQFSGYCRMIIAWGCVFACLIAAIYIGINSQGHNINRYSDWEVSFRSIENLKNFLGNYHRVSEQLQQMQDASLNSDVGQHFSGIARQLMAFIYLLGMFQMFATVILSVNIIPLLFGLVRGHYTERHVFILILAGCLSVILYGYLIWQDCLIKKYLFMPVVLLCPWVGFGIDRIFAFTQERHHKEFIAAAVFLIIFTVPALEFDKYFKSQDNLKSLAGSWIAKNEILKNSKNIFSDPGVEFHAGMENAFRHDERMILHHDGADKDFSKIARFALENKADVIVIYSRADRRKGITDFKCFNEIREFHDKKKFIKVYVSINCLSTLENPG